jgi:hypothetical protein
VQFICHGGCLYFGQAGGKLDVEVFDEDFVGDETVKEAIAVFLSQ